MIRLNYKKNALFYLIRKINEIRLHDTEILKVLMSPHSFQLFLYSPEFNHLFYSAYFKRLISLSSHNNKSFQKNLNVYTQSLDEIENF